MRLSHLGGVLLLAAAAHAELKVTAAFPNGSIGQVNHVGPLHLRLGVRGQVDQDGRNRQASWYSFVVTGVPRNAEVIIDLVDLPGEYNYQKNKGAITADTRPYWCEGKKCEWREAAGDFDANEPKWRIRMRPKKSTFRVSHLPPYTRLQLTKLRKELKPEVEVIGKTIQGQNVELWTFDRSGGNEKAPVAWLMFRQHAWEAGSSWAGEGMMRNLPADIIWKVLPWCDPDGIDKGGVRFNQRGFDLNRNWDSPNDPSLRPEILAQKTAMEAWLAEGNKIDFFLSIHNTETGEYLEGPEGSKLGEALYSALREKTTFDPDRVYFSRMKIDSPTRANVIQWLWNTHQVPAFLMELRIAQSKKLGARPTPATWKEFGGQLAERIAAQLLPPVN